MKTKAAVAWKAGEPLRIEEVDLDGPKAGEVLVEIIATASATPTPSPCRAAIRRACSPRSSATRAPGSCARPGRA